MSLRPYRQAHRPSAWPVGAHTAFQVITEGAVLLFVVAAWLVGLVVLAAVMS